jgi:hypothetical protein
VQAVLEEAIHSHDREEVSMALTISDTIGHSKEHLPLLIELLRQEWHYEHEQLVDMIEEFNSEEAIDVLEWATQVRLDYLKANDSASLAQRAIYALAVIPGQRARNVLESIAHSSNRQRRAWAKHVLKS